MGLQAGVFPILGALYYPHLGENAIERQILADTHLVTGTGAHQRGVEHRHEVYAHLIRWMAAVKRLSVAGQKPSDINSRQGLQATISRCNFDHEMAWETFTTPLLISWVIAMGALTTVFRPYFCCVDDARGE